MRATVPARLGAACMAIALAGLLAPSDAVGACKRNAYGIMTSPNPLEECSGGSGYNMRGTRENDRKLDSYYRRKSEPEHKSMGLGGYKSRFDDDPNKDSFGRPLPESPYGYERDSMGVSRPNLSGDCETDVIGVRRCR